jgi:hypothetical protein
MKPPSAASRSAPSESVDRCRKLAKFLTAGRITFDEYAYNVTLGIVYGPVDDTAACIETIPDGVVTLCADYLRTTLEPVDFMPCPRPFLAWEPSQEQIEATKRRLRSKYLRLYQLKVGKQPGGAQSEATDFNTTS